MRAPPENVGRQDGSSRLEIAVRRVLEDVMSRQHGLAIEGRNSGTVNGKPLGLVSLSGGRISAMAVTSFVSKDNFRFFNCIGVGRLQTQGFRPWASACRSRLDGSTESASGWKSLGAEPFPAGADLPLLGIAGPRVEAVPLSMNCAWRHCAFRSRRAPRRPSRWSAQHDGPGFAGQFARCGDPGRCDIVAKFNGRTPRHGGLYALGHRRSGQFLQFEKILPCLSNLRCLHSDQPNETAIDCDTGDLG